MMICKAQAEELIAKANKGDASSGISHSQFCAIMKVSLSLSLWAGCKA
jgi:hypothetical protein